MEKLKVRNFELMSHSQVKDPRFLRKPVQASVKHKHEKHIPLASMPQHRGCEEGGGMFSALSRKKGNDLKTSQRRFSPFIPALLKAGVVSAICAGWRKL